MDPEDRLKRMVEDTGEIEPTSGGFEITLLKPTLFPWYKVINELIEIGHEIWIAKKENRICITSKPSAL